MGHGWTRRLPALLAAAALGLGAAACGEDEEDPPAQTGATEEATPAATETPAEPETSPDAATAVSGGRTTLELDGSTLRFFEAVGVELEPIGAAEATTEGLRFPITGGELDQDAEMGEVRHEGGLRFVAGDQSLEATDLILQPDEGVVTAQVGDRRVPLLSVELGDAEPATEIDRIRVTGRAATLAPGTAPLINERLGIALDRGLRLGRLVVDAERP